MIYHLNPDIQYTDRTYLTQWLTKDTLVITESDFLNLELRNAIANHPIKNLLLDVTHNPVFNNQIPQEWYLLHQQHIKFPMLTNNFTEWYQSCDPSRVFFPLFLWMFSLKNPLWYNHIVFDVVSNKTQTIMCLNNYIRPHRTWLWNEFNQKNLLDKMMYTFVGHRGLPNDILFRPGVADLGVGHDVYSEYSVNIVTETSVDLPFISEKTCKPFLAQQIPVIVGGAGVNKFLKDVGLDMFEDIVPWHRWDNEPDSSTRLQQIANFIEQWINEGTILDDYYRVLTRVEHNKHYFHSKEFRNRIMIQMKNFNS